MVVCMSNGPGLHRLQRSHVPKSSSTSSPTLTMDHHTVDDINPAWLRTLNYGSSGIFLIMSNAGFISSAVLSGEINNARSPGSRG